MIKRWKTPGYRERMGKLSREIWKNKEFREMMSKKGKKQGIKTSEMSMNISYNNNNYHSASEAVIANLFEKYLNWKVEKGKTWQVNDKGINNGGIDFLLENEEVFVEYHPSKVFYGKGGRGDFRSREEYQKFMRIKNKIRDEKSPNRVMKSNDIERIIIMLYKGSVSPNSQVSSVKPIGIAKIVAPMITCNMFLKRKRYFTGSMILSKVASVS